MLTPGRRLGPYEIVAPIGAGGMGEVFKARDTRLDRSVAVKVLPAEFAQNANLKLRFEREARAISQFTHPHICTLYDVGTDDGVEYLVMEYLEGESLADRLAKGALPVDQVIRYGIEIAGALERAHKAGIVHRDLKPGNVMLTRTGAKLLDFGLAKEAEGNSAIAALTSMRTEQKASLTEEGTIVGTFQYMAPEQLEGGAVDARTDLFALGAVLYEMATGRRAFTGRSKASLIASILTTQPPPVSESQPASPAALDRLIRTCLEKDPDERFQSAHDVRLALQWIGDGTASTEAVTRRKRSRASAVAATLFALLAIVAGALFVRERLARRQQPLTRTSIEPPPNMALAVTDVGAPPEISPDGRMVVFGVLDGTQRKLWLRSLDAIDAQPLNGTESATFPFWSPDSKYIAFFANGKLRKIDTAGMTASDICTIVDGRGGTWSGDTIVFGGRYTPLYRVAASGGDPAPVTQLRPHEVSHRWPHFLPDGDHFLFLAAPLGSEDPRNEISVGSLSTKSVRRLLNATSNPMYYDGHLLFVRDGALYAQRLEERKLELTGEPRPLGERQIRNSPVYSRSVISVSPAGSAVYQRGEGSLTSELIWYDRSGKELGVIGDAQPYGNVALAPDEKKVAFSLRPPNGSLWMIDLVRGVKSRLTFGMQDGAPLWSPDGRKLVFSSKRQAYVDLYLRDLTTGEERPLVISDADKFPTSWSSDGSIVFYQTPGASASNDIYYVTLADGKTHVYLASPFGEGNPSISPDGKWIAYQGNETGTIEVYLARFPPTGEKWQVSASSGSTPRWRRDGRELDFVQTSTNTLFSVPIKLDGASPDIGQPVPLFRFRPGGPFFAWAAADEGRRFLINARRGPEPPQEPLTLVQNLRVEP